MAVVVGPAGGGGLVFGVDDGGVGAETDEEFHGRSVASERCFVEGGGAVSGVDIEAESTSSAMACGRLASAARAIRSGRCCSAAGSRV